jgi:histidinol-phosphate aminotransferase
LNRPVTQPTDLTSARPISENPSGPAVVPADSADGLALIKPAVRAQAAYTLVSPQALRKLNQNECPYDLPPELKQEVLEQIAGLPWQRYPGFSPPELLARLAEHYDWVPAGVLVGNGSNELIQATLSVTLGSGDTVVAPSPTFSLYRLLTNVLGGRYFPIGLGPQFEYDVGRLIEAAVRERARVVILNSPNNPTGTALPTGAVERVLDETDALVVCDEAYQDFGGPSAIPLLLVSSRLVILRTFSKAFGMAGLRFGLALAHPDITRELAKGKLPYNVNVMTLAAAGIALRHAPSFEARTREIVATRDRFLQALAKIPGLTPFASSANFVLIRFHTLPAREVYRRLLEQHGILVRDVSSGADLAECLRISIGTPADMEAVLRALAEILATPGERRP